MIQQQCFLYQREVQQGLERKGYPPALGARSLNRWTAREVWVSISEVGVGRVFFKYFLASLHYLIQNQTKQEKILEDGGKAEKETGSLPELMYKETATASS